jgi:hypothetical protein
VGRAAPGRRPCLHPRRKRLALADERVDDDERRVLSGIFSRVTEATVDPAVWDDIERFKLRHGIE